LQVVGIFEGINDGFGREAVADGIAPSAPDTGPVLSLALRRLASI
jgi:hypothetical protein